MVANAYNANAGVCLEFALVCFIIIFDFFLVTTIKTTTYSTATTVTDAKEHDPCPDCLRKDFV